VLVQSPENTVPAPWDVSEEERLRIACRAASIGVWQWDLLSNEMQYSDIARAICGFGPTEPITFEMVRNVTHPDDYGRTSALAQRALDPTIRESSEFRYRVIRADTGAVRWVKAYGEAKFATDNGTERAILFIGTIQDITAETEREQALADSEDRLRMAIEVGGMAVWEVDVNTDTVVGSPELNRLYGFPETSTPTLDEFRSRYAPGERKRITELSQTILNNGGTKLQFEIKHVWPNGAVKWLLMRAQVGKDREANGMRVIGAVRDVTDEKQHEEHLTTVARELRHRLLNAISVIGAIASRSWPASFPDSKKDFQARLRAIGRATDLIFLQEKGLAKVTLKQVLFEITAPYRGQTSDPFLFEGPDVNVETHIRPLAMAFHELCTNALKYGSLSADEGKVAVTWAVLPDSRLEIKWQEMNGPRVAVPDRTGLGSTLLTKLLFNQPDAVSLEYNADGVQCTILLHDVGVPKRPD
jgi:PAS domain S-box-containing protein